MKRIFFALAVLFSAGLTLLPQAWSQVPGQPGQGLPFGPGAQGATLKQPWLEASPSSAPSRQSRPARYDP